MSVDQLRRVRAEVARAAEAFDASALDGEAARRALRLVGAIEGTLGSIKAALAARVAETHESRKSGTKNGAEEVARITKTSQSKAADTINTGNRMRDLDATNEAARDGQLSQEQLSMIADAAAINPGAEQRLLDTARSGVSLRDLRDACAAAKAEGDRDAEARRRRIHARRGMRTWTDREGVGHLHWADNPERIAAAVAGIQPARDRLFNAARTAGDRVDSQQLDADALHDTLTGAGSGSGSGAGSGDAKILVRIDLDALLRGYPIDGEVCEIAGYGPIAVSAVKDMVATGDPFLAAIVTAGEKVTGVVHLGRHPTALQMSALQWISPTCSNQACGQRWRVENDHRHDWAHTKVTLLEWLDRLCPHDHDLKTHHGWSLVEGTGKRAFVPPDHPRHPNNADNTGERQPRAGAPPPAAA